MRRDILQQILAARRTGRAVVRALDLESGEERLIDPASDASPLRGLAAAALVQETSRTVILEGHRIFLSVYPAPWEIVIVGAVHIAQALAALGAAAGFRVRVIDPRPAYATPDRFASATLERAWPEEALTARPLTPRSALIALAHDTKLDDPALAAAIRSPAFYVGALGSSRTQTRRLARLKDAGFSIAELSRIHGPVGLSIGARSPDEIAIAILADLIRVRRAPKSRVAGIVLAAGTATRMGGRKLALPVHGRPLVRHPVEAGLAAALDPLIVVTGHEADDVRRALAGLPVSFAHNEHFAEGLSSSLRAGLEALPAGCDGVAILLGDMPAISASLIERVRAPFDPKAGRTICVAKTRDGRRGHPVLWGRQFFGEMMALSGDQGARPLMAVHANHVTEIEAGDNAPLVDIDTPESFALLEADWEFSRCSESKTSISENPFIR